MWTNVAEPYRQQMEIWRKRIACWIRKRLQTHSEYVILIAFPLQQWLHERASVLRCTCIACVVTSFQLRLDISSVSVLVSIHYYWYTTTIQFRLGT